MQWRKEYRRFSEDSVNTSILMEGSEWWDRCYYYISPFRAFYPRDWNGPNFQRIYGIMDRGKNSVAYLRVWNRWRPHSIHLHHWVHATSVQHGGAQLPRSDNQEWNSTVSRDCSCDWCQCLVGWAWRVGWNLEGPYSTNTMLTRQKEVWGEYPFCTCQHWNSVVMADVQSPSTK
jgi:hypothetical protein